MPPDSQSSDVKTLVACARSALASSRALQRASSALLEATGGVDEDSDVEPTKSRMLQWESMSLVDPAYKGELESARSYFRRAERNLRELGNGGHSRNARQARQLLQKLSKAFSVAQGQADPFDLDRWASSAERAAKSVLMEYDR